MIVLFRNDNVKLPLSSRHDDRIAVPGTRGVDTFSFCSRDRRSFDLDLFSSKQSAFLGVRVLASHNHVRIIISQCSGALTRQSD